MTKDKRIDAYIEKAEPFAQPILKHLRKLVHQACPEIEENIKWGMPHFEYKGIVCSMASFKKHMAFGFFKAALMKDKNKVLSKVGETTMGDFGKVSSLKELPSDKIIIDYIKEAVKLNEEGIKVPKKKPGTKEIEVPAYFQKELKKNKEASKVFEGFSYTNKKDYIEWFEEAKTEETRNKRIETALEWIAEGKIRNWKYVKK